VAKQNKLKNQAGSLRIIGGKWRGRKLSFPDIEGLRPTADRVRETIFNWLQMKLGSARCLDLFAGSGALGFEAASRGATHVDLVEQSNQAVNHLRQSREQLSAQECHLHQATAQDFLSNSTEQYDIVFIDPPYQADLWSEIAELLINKQCLADNALIYLECPKQQQLPDLPENWLLIKDKTAGDVRYCLFRNE